MKVWSCTFGGGAMAARRARRAVREALAGELPEPRLADVELLVSELATNSVRHAGCDESAAILMEADVRDDYVRLLLCDEGDGFDEVEPEPDPRGASGYGLLLVDRLSDRWGIRRDGGFCVWFEVRRSAAAA